MTKYIAVVSGKGGAGKTTCTANIGHALFALGKKVVLLDANLATPNLSLQLGLMEPKGTLNNFLRKEKSLAEITHAHESGISIIPSSPSYSEFQKTQKNDSLNLSEIFEHLDETAEFVLVDSPGGLGSDVEQVLKNTDEAIIVVNPNLSSVVDGLKTIMLAKSSNNTIAGIILNMTNGGRNELAPAEVEKMLGHPIIANVKSHRKVRKAAHRQMPLNHLYPRSRLAKEFMKVAKHLTYEQP
ncbi:MAG: P-loop NTPase [Nanoarchaeota archaeon]